MSYIAVNINETKKETIRLAMKQPIYGKHGKEQTAVLMDCDTGKEVPEIILKRRGIYKITSLWCGKDHGLSRKNSGFSKDDAVILKKDILVNTSLLYHSVKTFYLRNENTPWKPQPFRHLQPTAVISDYYTTFQYCDD